MSRNIYDRAHDRDRVLSFDKQTFISTLVSVCLVFFLLSTALYSKCDEVDWLEKELEKSKEERDQQMRTAFNKENELETLRGIIDEMNREEEYLKAELDSRKRKIQELRHTLDGKGSDISRLESDAKKMKVELDSKNKELSSCQSSKESLYTEAKDCRKDLMYSQEKTKKMEEELKEQKMTSKENEDRFLKYFHLYNEEQKSHSECKYTGRTTYEELKKTQSEKAEGLKSQGWNLPLIGVLGIIVFVLIGCINIQYSKI